jgi:choline-sulfatase
MLSIAAVPPAGAATAAATQAAPAAGAKSDPSRPNILFILTDQMTPFLTSPYGSRAAITPNLNRLAAEGTLFENAYCNSPLCVPSRNSMWSGLLPSRIAAYDNGSEFPSALPSIPYVLRSAGYRTAVAGKCHFIGPDQRHGFEDRLTPCIFPAGFDMTPDWRLGPVYNRGTSIQNMFRALGPSRWNRQLGFDQHAFDNSVDWIRQSVTGNKTDPWFLTLALTQPHDPFTSTQECLDRYRNVEIPAPVQKGDIRRLSPTYEWFIIHHGIDREAVPVEKVKEVRRNYLAMISWIDDKVGELLNELKRLDLDKNTVVVFSSDHGEMMGDYGQFSKRLLLEWSSRVPLIVRAPGRGPAGARVAAPVSLSDLLPTFASISGAKTEFLIDGQSLWPAITGSGRWDERRPIVGEYLGEGAIEPMRMVRAGAMKYITVHGYGPQLFDLGKDPGETTNLAGRPEYASDEKQLRELSERDWDGPALKRAVLRSQQDRILLRSIARASGSPKWDYRPVEAGPYPR